MTSPQLTKEEDNLQLGTNPYSSRMPVTDPAQFYGRHDTVLHIAESIRSWQTFAVSGEPLLGKTSLLYYLVRPEGARTLSTFLKYIGNPAKYLFVLVELQRLPERNALGFWRYLLDRLIEEASKETARDVAEQKEYASNQISGNDYYEVQTSFESYLKQLKPKVIFLFDDFDIVINDFEKNSEVIQVTDKLRTLKEALDLNDKLNYIIMSNDPLVHLLKYKGITNPSPLTSIITPLKPLGLLDKDAADTLIREPSRQLPETSPKFNTDDISFIYKLAGRYPYFMKITCFYLFAARSLGDVDYATVRQQIEDDPHVRWLMKSLWDRLKQAEQVEELPLQTVLLQVAQGQKPDNFLALRELVQRGLVEEANATPYIFGELFRAFILRQSTSTATIVNDVTPPELTHLESNLYNYLVEHIGQTCSREQLEKAIWGNKVPKSEDALEQLVKRVRGKIEANAKQPIYLLNVRGQGYLLRTIPPNFL